jgi:hypothetical protein
MILLIYLSLQEAKDATTALCQMLKIDAAVNLDKPTEAKNYGRKVSVDEFFSEAKRKTSETKAPVIAESASTRVPAVSQPASSVLPVPPSSTPLLPAPTTLPVGVPPGQFAHPGAPTQDGPFPQPGVAPQQGTQNKQQKMSAVTEVEEWCKSMRLPPPKFDYFPLLQGSVGFLFLFRKFL